MVGILCFHNRYTRQGGEERPSCILHEALLLYTRQRTDFHPHKSHSVLSDGSMLESQWSDAYNMANIQNHLHIFIHEKGLSCSIRLMSACWMRFQKRNTVAIQSSNITILAYLFMESEKHQPYPQ